MRHRPHPNLTDLPSAIVGRALVWGDLLAPTRRRAGDLVSSLSISSLQLSECLAQLFRIIA